LEGGKRVSQETRVNLKIFMRHQIRETKEEGSLVVSERAKRVPDDGRACMLKSLGGKGGPI